MDQDIEQFYSELERSLTDYIRPIDYKERYMKLMLKQRNPVQNQYEGKTYSNYSE